MMRTVRGGSLAFSRMCARHPATPWKAAWMNAVVNTRVQSRASVLV